jgi:hypothetical protein
VKHTTFNLAAIMPAPGSFRVSNFSDEEMIAIWAQMSPSSSVEETRKRYYERKQQEAAAIALWVRMSAPIQLHITHITY